MTTAGLPATPGPRPRAEGEPDPRTVPEPRRGAPSARESAGRDAGIGASRGLALLLVVTALLGLLGSFVITVDKIKLMTNAAYVPSCTLSPVVSCTSVMRSWQASVFGFPNPVIGLVAFGAVTAIGMGLLAGARHRRWYWLGLNAGSLAGVVFCIWLMTQALYDIGALCLWCMLVWAATIAMFWYTTVHNLRHGVLPAPRQVVAAVQEFHWAVPLTWYLVIVALIATRFWNYWQTLLP